MKHTEPVQPYWMHWRSMTPGRRFLMVAPLFLMRRIFRQLPFISPALNTRAKSWTAIRQAELHIEVFLPAQVPDSELDSWMESRIYPVMSDIPALSDLITSMVASGYDYRRDDDAGLWSSADLTYVITYEM